MTKTKGTKRALLASVVSLMLCIAMLLGTTYAWFTDSVTSGRNMIQSGNLDVVLEYKTDVNGEWKVVNEDTKIFKEGALYEPGYTEVVFLRVSNEGSLALQYDMNINVFSEKPSTNVYGEEFKLSDYLAVGTYVQDEYSSGFNYADILLPTMFGTREEALSHVTPTTISEFKNVVTSDSPVLPGEQTAQVVAVVLTMPETVGNDANHAADAEVPTIELGINLFATQVPYESDSFGTDYDDIDVPDMIIETIDGTTYGKSINGEYVMISVDDYTIKNFEVNKNVTVLGTGDGVNDNDRVFGKNAPLETLALPNGLKEIKDNALNALPNLANVNLPNTLDTIGIQAFRMTGMSSVTIPKSVKLVKLGAFRDMANLTTVTVEGNVTFDNYAFRSCPKLETIYLLGDDVKFSGSQFATHADNGDANGITIYVKNETVKSRVEAAQTSAYGYKVEIIN